MCYLEILSVDLSDEFEVRGSMSVRGEVIVCSEGLRVMRYLCQSQKALLLRGNATPQYGQLFRQKSKEPSRRFEYHKTAN